MNPFKQAIRDLAIRFTAPLARLASPAAFVEMQICKHCSFVQTKAPFHDDDIMRLYHDYRSPSYNRERIKFEPPYATIASAVGQDEVEVRSRTTALNAFLRRILPANGTFTMLDYGGSDGKFIPDLPGSRFVFEISNIEPVPGVVRISSEQELGTYSLVLLAHVTEHVPHPLNLVRKLASYIEPGGYLYIETPQELTDQQREGLLRGTLALDIGIHEHINRYFPTTVSSLLEAAGYEVIAVESTPINLGWSKSVTIRALGRKALPSASS